MSSVFHNNGAKVTFLKKKSKSILSHLVTTLFKT